MDKTSQHARILKMIRAHKNGCPNYKFANNGILDYTARISELRKEGHIIYCERQKLPNGRATNVFNYFLNEEDKTDGIDYEVDKKVALATHNSHGHHRFSSILQTTFNLVGKG